MILKKLTCLCLAALTAISFGACEQQQPEEPVAPMKPVSDVKTWYFGGDSILSGDIKTETLFEGLEDTINPQKIYDKLNYTEAMLRGVYALNNVEEDVEKVRKEIPYEEVTFTKDSHKMIPFPIAVYLGKENISTKDTAYKYADYEAITDREVALLKFTTANQVGTTLCSYTVEGNKIQFTELNQTNNPGEEFAYQEGVATFEYQFKISGPYLTLSNGKNELTLTSYALTKNENGKISFTGYSAEKTPLFRELDYFATGDFFTYAVRSDGTYFYRSAYKVCEDGRLTIYLSDKEPGGQEKTTIKQFAYIMQSKASIAGKEFSVILFDGQKEYYYTDTMTEREARILVKDGAKEITEEQVKQIAEKKQDLFDDLQKEFTANDIPVNVHRKNGEILMQASALFKGDSAKLTKEGKDLIKNVLQVYTAVLSQDEYKEFVKKTRVEGHLAPTKDSTHESGLSLSKERANAVKKYCASVQSDMKLEAEGLSISKPIYDGNGKVDSAASHRVSLRFIVDTK